MIQNYKIEKETVTAYDDKKGFIDYEYQNNIDEILIQENVIKKLNGDIITKEFDKIQKENHFNNKFSKKITSIRIIGYIAISAAFSTLFWSYPLLALNFAIIVSLLTSIGIIFTDSFD